MPALGEHVKMPLPVLLAVAEDQDALEDVETQLAQRYAHDYRVECLGVPQEAQRLEQTAARARAERWPYEQFLEARRVCVEAGSRQ